MYRIDPYGGGVHSGSMRYIRFRLSIVALATVALWGTGVPPARASIIAGCVGPTETGVQLAVGWVDVGVMLNTEVPTPPNSLRVTAPDGKVVEYQGGEGLVAPNEFMPVWFAPVSIAGDYKLLVDEEFECMVTVEGGSDDAIKTDWEPRSAPIHGN